MSERKSNQVGSTVDRPKTAIEGSETENGGAGGGDPGHHRSRTTEPTLSGSEVHERVAAAESIGYDQLFEILKNERRRSVLRILREVKDNITLGALAERIAAEENETDVEQITSQERKRVYVGLYQCHLPKMDHYGAISYNKPRGTVDIGENTELFWYYLPDETDTAERRWPGIRSVLRRLWSFSP